MLSVNCLIDSHQLFRVMTVVLITYGLLFSFAVYWTCGGERMETSNKLLRDGWKVKIFSRWNYFKIQKFYV